MNPVKLVRLWYHLRKVRGGYREGAPKLVIDAYIKAGIFKEKDREQVMDILFRQQVSRALEDYAERLQR